MIEIISGTNRPGSRTLDISRIVLGLYQELGAKASLLDLRETGLAEADGSHYTGGQPEKLRPFVQRILQAEGLVIVTPEYNGSYPGILKYFIDHWPYPESFEYRPVCFIGLGGRFGGLRPVEHLQGVFGYRNAFMLPHRVFLMNIFGTLKEGKLNDSVAMELMQQQARDFLRFIKGLQSQSLDANNYQKIRALKK